MLLGPAIISVMTPLSSCCSLARISFSRALSSKCPDLFLTHSYIQIMLTRKLSQCNLSTVIKGDVIQEVFFFIPFWKQELERWNLTTVKVSTARNSAAYAGSETAIIRWSQLRPVTVRLCIFRAIFWCNRYPMIQNFDLASMQHRGRDILVCKEFGGYRGQCYLVARKKVCWGRRDQNVWCIGASSSVPRFSYSAARALNASRSQGAVDDEYWTSQ